MTTITRKQALGMYGFKTRLIAADLGITQGAVRMWGEGARKAGLDSWDAQIPEKPYLKLLRRRPECFKANGQIRKQYASPARPEKGRARDRNRPGPAMAACIEAGK